MGFAFVKLHKTIRASSNYQLTTIEQRRTAIVHN